ncbi:MAG: DUF6338 family protein [Streptosporangiaceae bacterium]
MVEHTVVALPGTVTALLIVIVAVLPGSVYTWAYERQTSPYGVTFADRTLRFIAVSLIFHLVLAWPEYAVYRGAIAGRGSLGLVQFVVLWLGLLVLVAVPASVGTILGGLYATRSTREGLGWLRRRLSAETERRLLRVALGRTPAPRAWDDLFSEHPSAYIRVRTPDGVWIAGRFAKDSYAAGFPNSTDLLLEEAWEVEQSSGVLGDAGFGYPVYVPAERIAWMEILPEEGSDG